MADRPQTSSLRSKIPLPATVGTAGLLVCAAVYAWLLWWERRTIEAEFQLDAEQRIGAVQRDFASDLEVIDAVRAFYAASRDVERAEFRNFTQPFLSRHPNLRQIGWAPRVTASDRARHEEDAGMQGDAGYRVLEVTDAGAMVAAGVREEYFPFWWRVPADDDTLPIGLDLASMPECQEALRRASETGQPQATDCLVRTLGDGRAGMFLLLAPLFAGGAAHKPPAKASVTGFIVEVCLLDETLDVETESLERDAMDVYVFDRSPSGDCRLLGGCSADGRPFSPGGPELTPASLQAGIHHDAEFTVPGQTWSIVCVPTEAFLDEHATWLPNLGLLAAAAVVALLFGYLGNLIGGARQVRQMVVQRTAELQQSNEALEREVAERKRAEEVIRNSEALYASLVENLPVQVLRKDLDGRFTFASKSFCQLMNKSREEIVGGTDFDLYPAALAQKFRDDDRRVIATGRLLAAVEENVRDGSTRFVEVLKSPVRDAGGEIVGVQVVFWDVTERKEAEAALEQERYLLHALMDNLPHNIYFKDAESRFIRINRALAEYFGLEDASQAIGQSDFDYFSEEHARQAMADEQAIMESGRPILDKEEKETWPDGHTTWAMSTKMPLYDGTGQVVGTFGVSRNITERKRAEEALRESEMKFRTLFDSSQDAIMTLTPEAGFLSGNPAAVRLFGCKDEEQFTTCTPALLSPEFQPDGTTSAEKAQQMMAIAMEEGSHFFEWQHRRIDGAEFPATVLLTRMTLGGEHMLQATVRDITKAKQAAQALHEAKEAAEAASRAKSDFLANMSHEIRTPMNAVIGMTELVLDTELTSSQREYLDMVRDSADSLLAVINDVLDFSKIEAGKLELIPTVFSLRESLGDTMKSLGLRAHTKGLELACRISQEPPDLLYGDVGRLRQIVVNLVGNAIKFTDEGEVVLEVEREAEEIGHVTLRFSVRDTGIGIPPEKCKSVFDAFEQVDTSTTRRFGGTGLGLAISTRLVEFMGGKIWVESEVGRGTTFYFTARFPIADERAAGVSREKPVILADAPVLVVDDNATNRRILVEMLRNWGMAPTAVAGVAEALPLLRQAHQDGNPFTLVLTDANMPQLDGFSLAEKIKRDDQLSSTVIMMLTSGGRAGDVSRCERLGLAAYLLKPIKQSELFDAIVMALGITGPEDQAPELFAAERADELPPLCILLAEDSLVNQKLAVGLLEKHGHSVVVANHGREAIAALQSGGRFDLVLMDIQMPEMDGFEATAAIRAEEARRGGHVPIIAMTAHAMKGDREECLAAGMDDYVAKPIRAKTLFQTIRNVLDGKGATAAERADAAAPSETKVDWSHAREAVGGDPDLLDGIIEAFFEESPDSMEAVRRAVADGRCDALRRAAHTLKGTLGLFAPEAARHARQLEDMAKSGRTDGAEPIVVALEQALADVTAALKDRPRHESPSA